MHHSIRLLASAALVALIACAKTSTPAPPAFRYPDLMREAKIEGPVRFRVRLDSAGSPQLTTFQVIATPNPAFTPAVRNALEGWRDSTMAGRTVEHAVLFVLMDTAATDSIARCRSSASEWAVCARRGRPHTLY